MKRCHNWATLDLFQEASAEQVMVSFSILLPLQGSAVRFFILCNQLLPCCSQHRAQGTVVSKHLRWFCSDSRENSLKSASSPVLLGNGISEHRWIWLCTLYSLKCAISLLFPLLAWGFSVGLSWNFIYSQVKSKRGRNVPYGRVETEFPEFNSWRTSYVCHLPAAPGVSRAWALVISLSWIPFNLEFKQFLHLQTLE